MSSSKVLDNLNPVALKKNVKTKPLQPMSAIKLTRAERAQVLRAAELIETGHHKYSCTALLELAGRDLTQKYGDFYGMPYRFVWNFEDGSELTKEIRVLMLLTFAEVCK